MTCLAQVWLECAQGPKLLELEFACLAHTVFALLALFFGLLVEVFEDAVLAMDLRCASYGIGVYNLVATGCTSSRLHAGAGLRSHQHLTAIALVQFALADVGPERAVWAQVLRRLQTGSLLVLLLLAARLNQEVLVPRVTLLLGSFLRIGALGSSVLLTGLGAAAQAKSAPSRQRHRIYLFTSGISIAIVLCLEAERVQTFGFLLRKHTASLVYLRDELVLFDGHRSLALPQIATAASTGAKITFEGQLRVDEALELH